MITLSLSSYLVVSLNATSVPFSSSSNSKKSFYSSTKPFYLSADICRNSALSIPGSVSKVVIYIGYLSIFSSDTLFYNAIINRSPF